MLKLSTLILICIAVIAFKDTDFQVKMQNFRLKIQHFRFKLQHFKINSNYDLKVKNSPPFFESSLKSHELIADNYKGLVQKIINIRGRVVHAKLTLNYNRGKQKCRSPPVKLV